MIKFNNKRDQFQAELKNDIVKIKHCLDILVFADKTSNYYKINTKDYQKLLKENIAGTYKKVLINLEKTINPEAKSTTKKLELSDRIAYLARSPAYIILKDHKENFLSKSTSRLITPKRAKLEKSAKI